jgi:sialic acid synthase SpsE
MMDLKLANHLIGLDHPTYFIADIAANHDGSLERAKLLIRLAKEAGADAAKFQNFECAEDRFRLRFYPYGCPGFSPGKMEKIGF